jgi:peptidoglycan hydrolase-like protein with peptidoglycan-binding domain
MKNKTKILFAIALCIFFNATIINSQSTPKSTNTSCLNITRNLKLGVRDYSENSEVKSLQNFLINYNYLKTDPTGYFGLLTLNAVKDFQKQNGLPAVGMVGPLTKEKIRNTTCSSAKNIETSNPTGSTLPKIETTVNTASIPHTSGNFSEWERNWGVIEVNNEGVLTLKASAETNGGQISFKDSKELSDYSVLLNTFIKQGTVNILVRYVNDDNFLACNFSGRYIEIVQKINGVSSVVAYTSVAEYPYATFFNESTNLGVSVNGKTIGCTLVGNEYNVSFNNIDSSLMKGGVAIQTWVNVKGISEINIRNITIN